MVTGSDYPKRSRRPNEMATGGRALRPYRRQLRPRKETHAALPSRSPRSFVFVGRCAHGPATARSRSSQVQCVVTDLGCEDQGLPTS